MKLLILILTLFISGCISSNRGNIDESEPGFMPAKFYTHLTKYQRRYCGSKAGYRNLELYYEVYEIPQQEVSLASGTVKPQKWVGKAIEKQPVNFYQISGEKTGRNGNKCTWYSFQHSQKAPTNCHFTKIIHDGNSDLSEMSCIQP